MDQKGESVKARNFIGLQKTRRESSSAVELERLGKCKQDLLMEYMWRMEYMWSDRVDEIY